MNIISRDLADLVFRALFCSIFVGLGGEHLFSDGLISKLMPSWVPYPRTVSIACGLWLTTWGLLLLIGWRVKTAALALAAFLVVVTLAVHAPGVMFHSLEIPDEHYWLWEILQRSNLVKNLCLLGVCLQLLHHELGKYSLESYLRSQRKDISRPLN